MFFIIYSKFHKWILDVLLLTNVEYAVKPNNFYLTLIFISKCRWKSLRIDELAKQDLQLQVL